MTFAEIEALPSAAERVAAYQAYVEAHPNHPLGWFNLAVEHEAGRSYDEARAAAETVRSLDVVLFALLPARVRSLLGAGPGGSAATDAGVEVGGYRITRVASASESQLLYDAVRISDETPVTLRRMLDVSHGGAKAIFQLALAAPRTAAIARPLEMIDAADRGPMLALERVRGEPLRGDRRALLDADVALRLIRVAADAVRGLHRAGALHGDLRPESVLRDHTRGGEIVVLGGRAAGAASPTPRGHLAWQAPEEAAGELTSPASDVYGLGLLLHHLLTGAEPGGLADRAPIRRTSDWPELDELLADATARDPAARLGIDELISRIDQLLARKEVPAVVGKWRLGRLLGEGGFGRVFAAENVDISDFRAAVKVLHPFMARDRDMRRRFLNEASAASRIDHPGVVRMLDGGVLDDGTCYIAMELLQGGDLGERLEHGPLPIDRAARWTREAASALASAHAAKIVHRDIKPSNLVFTRRGDGEQLRVVDFGTALLRGEPTREGVPYTASGHIWGTPEYMAPEQWQMLRDLDGRVDIYSLGLVLWECLAGRRPFTASTVFDWQQAHLSTTLPPLAEVAPMAPPRLAALVERMTAKRREDRIATMEEVVAELDAILAQPATRRIEPPTPPTTTPTPPTPPTAPTPPTPPAPKPPSPPEATPRRRWTRPLIAAGVVAALGGGALAVWKLWPTDPVHRVVDPEPPPDAEPKPPTDPTVPDTGVPDPGLARPCAIPIGGLRDPNAREPRTDVVYSVPIDGLPSKGPDNALVTIVEVSDFWSSSWYTKRSRLAKVLERLGPDVRFVYAPGPGANEELARPTRLAACAAHRQRQFWRFYDKILMLLSQDFPEDYPGDIADQLLTHDADTLPAGLAAIAQRMVDNPRQYPVDLAGPICARWGDLDLLDVRRIGVETSPVYLINGRYVRDVDAARILEVYREEQRRASACMASPDAPPDYYAYLVARGQKKLR